MSASPAVTDVEVVGVKASERGDNGDAAALVLVHADDGSVGLGEANGPPAAIAAYLLDRRGQGGWDQDPLELVQGRPADDPRGAWKALVAGTPWSARTGLGAVAVAGLDTALWDLAGRVTGRPVHALLSSDGPRPVVPYATLYHGAGPFAEVRARTLDALGAAVDLGYRAVKVEALPETTDGGPEVVALVEAARDVAGADVALLCDVGYRWTTADEALPWVGALEAAGVALLEAPFPPQDVEQHRRLIAATSVPVGSGDLLTGPADYAPLRAAGVDVLQAGAARTGVSGMVELVRDQTAVGRRFVPWGWSATMIATAANLHAAAASDGVPWVEDVPLALYPDLRLRAELAGPEPELRDGLLVVPDGPGLGVDLDPDALRRFTIPASTT